MNDQFREHYNRGEAYKFAGDYEASTEAYQQALSHYAAYAEAWYNVGALLLKLKRHEEAEPYLHQAIVVYNQRIEAGINAAYNLFGKACAFSLLQNRDSTLTALQQALELDATYAEEVIHEEDFKPYYDDPELAQILQPHLQQLKIRRYRGESLSKTQLNKHQHTIRKMFVHTLRNLNWQVDQQETLFEDGFSLAPQALGEYPGNLVYTLRLGLHVDSWLIVLELSKPNDSQTFHFYLAEAEVDRQLVALLEAIGDFQNTINERNWMTNLKSVIPLCKDCLYELPDGMKVKLSLITTYE